MHHQKYEILRPMPNDSDNKFSKWMLVTSCLTIVLLLSFASCTKDQECDELFARADSQVKGGAYDDFNRDDVYQIYEY